jgi:ADP-ribose pyrophosphatase
MVPDSPSLKTLLAQGRHLQFVARNGWEYVERPGVAGIVVILGLTDHGGVVLVTQWREPVGAWVVEWPAGLAGDHPGAPGEELAAAARREFLEETGFVAASMEPVLAGPPSPGISSEVVTFFRARGLRRLAPGGGVAGEGVRAHVVALSGLDDWLGRMREQGYLVDPKVLAGAYVLHKELDEGMHD